MAISQSYSLTRSEKAVGSLVLAVAGRLDVKAVHAFEVETASIFSGAVPEQLTIDLSGLNHADSAGALALIRLERQARDHAIPFAFIGINDVVGGMINLIDRDALVRAPIYREKAAPSVLESFGDAIDKVCRDFVSVMTFLGEFLIALGSALSRPGAIRWSETFFYMRKAGVEALPIVGLISLLIGLIMAFMSSLQLKQFGANIYVASLVGISIVKELGPMMTAIIVAGRSGSAFAAEIGTMMVNEEVDALVTMGFNPMSFLALPKVIASIAVVPLLTLYSMMFGILGGLLVGLVGLDLTLYTYLQNTFNSIDIWDVLISLIKSAVFAALIAGIGCQRGFKVLRGAEAVGEATTSAVVAAIFLIIVADSLFAIVTHYL